ncbi:MAG: hypothetical protein HN348_14790 [Proteobacteria bacterium]|nr:hypothetical protein [Pseudomonadota bacterium]
MSGIGIITNPKARRNLRNPAIAQQLAEILGDCGSVCAPEDFDNLHLLTREFCERDIDVLCINGGDGTIHAAMTTMVRAYGDKPLPPVALLCGGTMNTIAKGIGIQGKPLPILEEVVSTYKQKVDFVTRPRWLMKVDGNRYGFMLGTGVFANYLEQYYEGTPSVPWAMWVLARGVLSAFVGGIHIRRMMRRHHGVARADDETWPRTEWAAVAAGTVDQVGLGFSPFYECLENPGKMHAVGLGSRPVQLVMELIPAIRHQPLQHPDNFSKVCVSLTLTANEQVTYMLDGDFYRGKNTLTVEIGPRVDFIQPFTKPSTST